MAKSEDDFYWIDRDGLRRHRTQSANEPGRGTVMVTIPGDIKRKVAIKFLRMLADELEQRGRLS